MASPSPEALAQLQKLDSLKAAQFVGPREPSQESRDQLAKLDTIRKARFAQMGSLMESYGPGRNMAAHITDPKNVTAEFPPLSTSIDPEQVGREQQLQSALAEARKQRLEKAGIGTLDAYVGPDVAAGRALHGAGQVLAAIPSDAAAGWVNAFDPDYHGEDDYENIKAAVGGRPLPVEETISTMPEPARTISRFPVGVASMTPQIAAAALFKRVGMVPSAANFTAFGLTPEGLNAWEGIKMAALPSVGKVGEGIADSLISKNVFAVDTVAGQKLLQSFSAGALELAYLQGLSMPNWGKLTPDQRKEEVLDNFALIFGMRSAQVPGLLKYRNAEMAQDSRFNEIVRRSASDAIDRNQGGWLELETRPREEGQLSTDPTDVNQPFKGRVIPAEPIAEGEIHPNESMVPKAGDLTGGMPEGSMEPDMSPPLTSRPEPEEPYTPGPLDIRNTLTPEGPMQRGRMSEELGVPLTRDPAKMPSSRETPMDIRRKLQERSRSQPKPMVNPPPGPVQEGRGAESLGVPLDRGNAYQRNPTPMEIRQRLQDRSRSQPKQQESATNALKPEEWQVTVQQAELPGMKTWVQFDRVSKDGKTAPAGWGTLKDNGITDPVPDFSTLPTGKYTFNEAVSLLNKEGENKTASEVGNKGTFDPNNPDILAMESKSQGGPEQAPRVDPDYADILQHTSRELTPKFILETIKARTPHYAELADKLIASGVNPTFEIVDDIRSENPKLKNAAGLYIPADHSIQVKRFTGDFGGVAIHEMVHAATVWGLRTDKKLQNEVYGLLQLTRRAFPTVLEYTGDWYGLKNVDEFVSEAFTNPMFQAELHKIHLGDGQTLFDKFVQMLMRFLHITPGNETVLDRVMRITEPTFKTGKVGEGEALPSMVRRPEKITEVFRGKEAERPGSGEEFVRSQQAAEVVASTPAARRVIDRLNMLSGEPVDLKDPESVLRQAVANRVMGDRRIRSQLAEPIEGLRQTSRLLGHSLDNYFTLKADTNARPEIKSRAALDALDVLDKWGKAAGTFYASYENKSQKIKTELADAIKDKDWHNYTRDTLAILVKDIREAGRQMMRSSKDAGALGVYQKMGKESESVRNTVEFISRFADFDLVINKVIKGPTDLIAHLSNEAKKAFPDQTMEQAVGASEDVIKYVAKLVMESEPLRDRVMEGQFFLREKASAHPLKDFMKEISNSVGAGNYMAALNAYTRGVGKTAIEADKARRSANFFAREEQKLLVRLEALNQVKSIYDQIRSDPEFIASQNSVYGDLGVKAIMKGLSHDSFVMKPIKAGGEDIVLSFSDTTKAGALKTLEAFKKYKEEAAAYLGNTEAPDYNPAKAAALRDFIRQYDWYANPTINPQQPRTIPSVLMAIPRKIFGLVGGVDQIPNVVLKYGGGFAADFASKTLNALLTAKEVGLASYYDHQPRLAHSLMEALKSHNLDQRNIDLWKKEVFYPLAASRQYFENVGVLEAGSVIGNGYEVTRADIGYLKALRDYEKSIIRKLTATDENFYSVIKNMPAGIVEKFGSQPRLRLPAETGEDTIGRRLGTIFALANDWFEARTDVDRIAVLDANLSRLVFGYLADAPRASFPHRYTYRGEVKEIFQQGRYGNPVGSFHDLTERIVDLWNTHGDRDPITGEDVSANLLKEFGELFKKIKDEREFLDNQKVKIKIFGGENAMNTARGSQIVPGLWYDYGSMTDPEHVAHLNTSLSKFYIEHLNSVEALHRSLSQIVEKFDLNQKANPNVSIHATSKADRIEGKDFYSWGEAITAQHQVAEYLDKLRAAYNAESAARKVGGRSTAGDTASDLVVASLLMGPQANTFNSFGGFLSITLHDLVMRNHSAFWSLARNVAIEGPRAFRELGNVMFNPNNKLFAKAPLIGPIFNHLASYFEGTRALYTTARRDAIVTSKDLGKQLAAQWEWRDSGGQVVEIPPDQGAIGTGSKRIEATIRMLTKTMKSSSVMFVDSRVNLTAFRLAAEMVQDLENRALKYGELRVRRAAQEGRDPYDPGDIANTFSPAELVKKSWFKIGDEETAAANLREHLKREADINIDSRMMEFYRRYKAATTDAERDSVSLLTDGEVRQLVLAKAAYINLATFGNRPIASRSSKVAQKLSLFLGYPAFFLYKMAGMFNRISTDPAYKGYRKSMPTLVGAVVLAAIIGSLGIAVTEEEKQLVQNKIGSTPTIFDAVGAGDLPAALALGAAATIPFYGSIYNLVSGNQFKRGFDLNSQFVFLNLATDATKMMKEVWQTGSAERPVINFARRWTFPANYLGGFLPQISGLQEFTNTRNILTKVAKGSGMESFLRKQTGATDVNYGPTTPLLNDFANAVGKGDQKGIQESWDALVNFYVKGGKTPEEARLRAMAGISTRNPISRVFGGKVTEGQLNELFAKMTPKEKSVVSRVLNNYDAALAQVGGKASFTKEKAAANKTKAPRQPKAPRTLAQRALSRNSRTRNPMLRINRRLGIREPKLAVAKKKRTRSPVAA